MEIENVLTILLFVIPGVVSDKISHIIDGPAKKDYSNFTTIVNGILSSLPILLISTMIFTKVNEINDWEKLLVLFKNLEYLTYFILLIFTISIIWGMLNIATKKVRIGIVNIIRRTFRKNDLSDKTCWERFLLENKEVRYLEVIQNGISTKGFAAIYATLNEDTAIVLDTDEILFEYDDYEPEKLFTKVIGTYIDIEKNVVIKDYDINSYNDWVEEKKKIVVAIS